MLIWYLINNYCHFVLVIQVEIIQVPGIQEIMHRLQEIMHTVIMVIPAHVMNTLLEDTGT